jgi:hypothetical protein
MGGSGVSRYLGPDFIGHRPPWPFIENRKYQADESENMSYSKVRVNYVQ